MTITTRSNEALISLSRWGRIIGILNIMNVCFFMTYIFAQKLMTVDGGTISISRGLPIPFFRIWTPLFVIVFFLIPAIFLTIASFKLYNVSYNNKVEDFSSGLKFMRIHFYYCLIANCILLVSPWVAFPIISYFPESLR